jgi:hypothetical protein
MVVASSFFLLSSTNHSIGVVVVMMKNCTRFRQYKQLVQEEVEQELAG